MGKRCSSNLSCSREILNGSLFLWVGLSCWGNHLFLLIKSLVLYKQDNLSYYDSLRNMTWTRILLINPNSRLVVYSDCSQDEERSYKLRFILVCYLSCFILGLKRLVTLSCPASFGDFHIRTTGSHVALRALNSGTESGGELFKGSKDMASLLVCTWKYIFWLGSRDFWLVTS